MKFLIPLLLFSSMAFSEVELANRGLRCPRWQKYYRGACCDKLPDGGVKCPPRKHHPWEGPGRSDADTTVTIETAQGIYTEGLQSDDDSLPIELVSNRSRTSIAYFYSGSWCSGRVVATAPVIVTGNHWDFTVGHCTGTGEASLSTRINGVCNNFYQPKNYPCTW
jgi:hypothetical protein